MPAVSSASGRPVPTWPAPAEAVTPEVPETLSLTLLEGRPDVAAQRAAWESAFQRVQAARAAFYPSLRLSGTLGAELVTALGEHLFEPGGIFRLQQFEEGLGALGIQAHRGGHWRRVLSRVGAVGFV